MQKIVCTLFLLLVILTAQGQKKVENTLTDKPQAVPGTKVSIIPPEGFENAVHFLGFQHNESGASIMVIDIPGPYSETSKSLTKDQLLGQGIQVQKMNTLSVNGLPATFISGSQEAYGTEFHKYILIFGTEKETITIHSACPKKDKKTAEALEKSILSVYYDGKRTINPFDILEYTIDVSGTKLKFGKSMANSLIFTVDGNVPTLSDDQTSLVIAKSISEIERNNKKQFAVSRLKKLPLTIDSIQSVKEIEIDRLAGYEIEAQSNQKSSNLKQSIYQVILFSGDIYYLLVGTTNDATGRSLKEIKTAVKTFKLK